MDSLTNRINIFLETKMITDDEYHILNKWIEIINNYIESYDMDKMERMITHVAMMMRRNRLYEDIGEFPIELYDSMKELPHYQITLDIVEELIQYYEVSENERKYLILHIANMFTKEDDHGF